MTLLMSGLLCESLGVVDRAVQSGPCQAGPTRQMKLVYQCQGDHNWHWMTAETQVNWHTPIMIIIIGTWGREGRRVRERERERERMRERKRERVYTCMYSILCGTQDIKYVCMYITRFPFGHYKNRSIPKSSPPPKHTCKIHY